MNKRLANINHASYCSGKQQGLTLIELMVSITIGLILTAGVIQIFVGSNQTYRFQESMSRIQENGRFAIETIATDLRNADFRGCGGRSADPALLQNLLDDGEANDVDFFSESLTGFAGTGSGHSPSLPTALSSATPTPSQDSDVVRIRAAGDGGARISGHQSSGKNLFVFDASGIQTGDIVMASDCETATVFQVTPGGAGGGAGGGGGGGPGGGGGGGGAVGSPLGYNSGGAVSPGNRNDDMNKEFANGGEVTSFRQNAYYIADSPTTGEPALFRQSADGSVSELVEGAERMVLRFGEDTNGDFEVNEYRSAGAVSDWESVRAVRVSLLVRGRDDNVTDENQELAVPVDAAGTTTAPDRRLRQVFTATISLRNRLE